MNYAKYAPEHVGDDSRADGKLLPQLASDALHAYVRSTRWNADTMHPSRSISGDLDEDQRTLRE